MILREADRGEGTEPLGLSTPIWRKPHFINYWAPPLLWGLAVLAMSGNMGSGANTRNVLQWLLSWFVALKPAQLDLINFYVRKTGHLLAYGFMHFLWFRALREHAGYGPHRAFLWALGFCLFFASMDEGRQGFYPSRDSSIGDVILDMSGASLAGLITLAVWRPRPSALRSPGIGGGKPSDRNNLCVAPLKSAKGEFTLTSEPAKNYAPGSF
jgi:VanZ family protein